MKPSSEIDTRPIRNPRAFAIAGRFRLYFNSHAYAPLVWSIMVMDGETITLEFSVHAVSIDAPTKAVYRPKATPDSEDGMPSAFLDIDGVLRVDQLGQAIIASA